MPLSLFSNSIFTVVVIATFFIGMGMFGAVVFIPLFVQGVVGSSATNSGLVLTPMMLGAVVSSTISGQLLSRWNHYRIIALAGVVVMTAGMLMMTFMDSNTSNGEVTRNMVMIGLGLGVSFPVFTIVVQNAFPYSFMGLVTAFVQFFRSMGGALGVSILGALLASRLSGNLLANLSEETRNAIGLEQLSEFENPNALVSPEALEGLRERLAGMGETDPAIVENLIFAMKEALASSLQDVFIVSTVLVGVSVLVVMFLKEIPLRKVHYPEGPPSSEQVTETAGETGPSSTPHLE